MDNLFSTKIVTMEDIKNYKKIVLWGAGFASGYPIEYFGTSNIYALFDNDSTKWGKNINGLVVESPDEARKKIDTDTAVIVSTAGYVYEIATSIIDAGIATKDQLFCSSGAIYEKWRFIPETITNARKEIEWVYESLADEESKEYYVNFLKSCLDRSPFHLLDNSRCKRGYTYSADDGEIRVDKGNVIVDCGAFNGDTARLFLGMTNNDCYIYCFEPVDENSLQIEKWINENGIKNVTNIRAGVGNSSHVDKVYSTGGITIKGSIGENLFGEASKVVNQIRVETLDNVLKGKHVDYIKMDIEGAEMSALKGGIETILNNRPKMLISAYHKVTDMWEIPKYVLGLNENYKVYLGHQPHVPYEPEFHFK